MVTRKSPCLNVEENGFFFDQLVFSIVKEEQIEIRFNLIDNRNDEIFFSSWLEVLV
jgi:hypothetical protein